MSGEESGGLMGRAGSRRRCAGWIPVLLTIALAGCSRQQLGLPRVEVSAVSPDGGRTALVRNHPALDPPSQSLWLRKADGEEVRVRRLGEDIGWCNTVVWSADGRRVGFLVQDAYLYLVDGVGAELVWEGWLADSQGAYPPAEVVRGLRLSEDGGAASFRRCRRRGGACNEAEWVALGE